jgi:hypothetical protein
MRVFQAISEEMFFVGNVNSSWSYLRKTLFGTGKIYRFLKKWQVYSRHEKETYVPQAISGEVFGMENI